MKYLFLIADGMGGWKGEAAAGMTCLEAADTPNMDQLAAAGIVGRCATIPPGMQPGSDVANMSLLGFDPAVHHTGRGPIEAAAQGLTLDPEDLVWRLNLVTVSEFSDAGNMLDYSSGHIQSEPAARLVNRLQAELADTTYDFMPGVQYRHLLIQKSGAATDDADLAINPPHDITDKPIKADLDLYRTSPALWNLVTRAVDVLAQDNDTKANAIWPWGQGRPLMLPDFSETFGLTGAVISAVDLIKGLGRASGMEVLDVPGATGLLDTNYQGKVAAALDFLAHGGDFVFVHLEGPDECGHGGDVACKVEAIRRFDQLVVAPLRQALQNEPCAWTIACDHYTPIAERTHTTDPVPFLLCAPGVEPSGIPAFTEAACEASGRLLTQGSELLPYVLRKTRG